MADVVIVVGAKRGAESVPVAELKQMVGRAGRKHGGAVCEAFVLVDEENAVEVEEGMSGDAQFEVSSSMKSCDDLLFHVVAEICSGLVSDVKSAEAWYSRSFGAFKGGNPSFEKVFEKLEEIGAAEQTPSGWIPTEIARIAADLYFHPADVRAWRDNFREIFEMGLERDDAAVAWALGSVPMAEAPGDFGKHRFVMSLFKDALPAGLTAMPGMVARSTLWWSMLGGPSVGRMRNRIREMRSDFGRVARVIMKLNKTEDWGMQGYLTELESRMKRGIPEILSSLCMIPGITKSRAAYLYNAGVRNRAEIRDNVETFDGEVDEDFLSVLKEIANGVR